MPVSKAPRLWLTLVVLAATVSLAPPAASASADRIVAAVRLEDDVARRVNVVRRWHGLSALRESRGLTAAARRHSREMGLEGYFEHDSASGTAFWRRIEHTYGSRGFGRWEVGENISWNTGRARAAEVVRQWMQSPAHRANLLSGAWQELGLGAFRVMRAGGAYGGRTVTIVTLDLGVRAR
jgi:uncharacterized protein YkwD